jgi:hypothetical protein
MYILLIIQKYLCVERKSNINNEKGKKKLGEDRKNTKETGIFLYE